jgi:CRP-like cAMP-binding protein/Fe-S-cluster-containing hydrogenase component 2
VLKQEHYQQAKWLPALFGRIQNKVFSNRSKASGRGVIRTADGAILDLIDPAAERTPEDVILGEMTCLSHYPRSATVTLEEDGEVLEIGSNVLHYLQRNRSSREIFDRAYRDRALAHYLRSSQLFNYPDPAARRDGNGSSPATPPDIMSEARDLSEALSGQRSLEPGVAQAVEQFRELTKRRRRLSLEVLGVVERLCQTIDAAKSSVHTSHLQLADRLAQAIPDERERLECVEFLRARAELVRVDKGQLIFRQGDRADHFYLVRLGFVRISQTNGQQDIVRNYLGPGSSFGEIGLLAPLLEGEGQADRPPSRRTATCTALDDVELVRIRGDHFQEMIDNFRGVRDKLVHYARTLLQRDDASRKALSGPIDQFLEQGLFEAQKLLVLDLESCTRCDECTRACADSHGGVTRLIREGLRFDKYLVASSCRSCLDPYCLVGCPVDAIHRRPRDGSDTSLEIVIEDWCIGCGQCAKNCPYGNINMYGFPEEATRDGHQVSWTQMKATTCDLCRKAVPNPNDDPSCVYACPHNAAFRMSGADLLARIKQAEDKP